MTRREKFLLAWTGVMLVVAACLIALFNLTGCTLRPYGEIIPNSGQAKFNAFLAGCPADNPNCVQIGGYFPPQPMAEGYGYYAPSAEPPILGTRVFPLQPGEIAPPPGSGRIFPIEPYQPQIICGETAGFLNCH